MVTDPWFYIAAVPAVLLFGISKGGFGGGIGVVAVPLMALTISPIQAAAILLPILCLMDLLSLWAYRGQWVWPELRVLLPASMLGIIAGTLLFGYMSPAVIRLLVGSVAIAFTVHYFVNASRSPDGNLSHYPQAVGTIAAAIAGFTSFIAHSGGPPINMYLLRRPLNRTDFVATTVVFFAVVNYVKLLPYAWLGQLDGSNLLTSAILAPLAPIGVFVGVWMHRRISDRIFFGVMYLMLFIVGAKLIADGLAAIW